MTDNIFVDTNILVYAHDLDAGTKRETAKRWLTDLWENRRGILSTQVLQEFYITLTRKLAIPLSTAVAKKTLRSYLSWEVVVNDGPILLHAIDIEEANKISFWDALIVAAAYAKNSTMLLTEDLNHGQNIEGILIHNPFL
jgi:predicted nucleic acid-binding protein